MNKSLTILALLALAACTADTPPAEPAAAAEEPAAEAAAEPAPAMPAAVASPEGARVFFLNIGDGDTVSSPFTVEFGLEGMSVTTAGDNTENSGHHHLIINAPLPDLSLPVPADDNHRHFGDGSASTELTLEPGQHTLQLLLGDWLHRPHDPAVYSDVITITVE
ncbi:MAG: DUF4399 domain-containing protein [Pseudomonadota bacterium]